MEGSTWQTHWETASGRCVHQPSYFQYKWWFRMVRVMEICRGRGPQWFIMTNNSEKKWLLMQKPPQGKRQKRGEITFALHLYLTHNSCCRFDLSESTIRMWLRKSDGLDYRGPSYNRLHSDRVPFQGTLQVPLSLYSDWSHYFTGVPGRGTGGYQDWSWPEQVSRMSQ